MARGFITGSALLDAVVGVFMFWLATILAGVALTLPFPVNLVVTIGCACGVVWLHLQRTRPGLPTRAAAACRLRPLHPTVAVYLALMLAMFAVGIGLIGLMISYGVRTTLPFDPVRGTVLQPMMRSIGGQIALGGYAIVAAPLIEELAFRGWVQRAIERRIGKVAGVTCAAALFAALHVWYGQIVLVLVPLVLGILWGTSVIRQRTLYAGVLLHGTWNAVMFSAAVSEAMTRRNWLVDRLSVISSRATFAVLLIVGLIMWTAILAGSRQRPRRVRIEPSYGETG